MPRHKTTKKKSPKHDKRPKKRAPQSAAVSAASLLANAKRVAASGKNLMPHLKEPAQKKRASFDPSEWPLHPDADYPDGEKGDVAVYPPEADMRRASRGVRFVPMGDIRQATFVGGIKRSFSPRCPILAGYSPRADMRPAARWDDFCLRDLRRVGPSPSLN